MVRIIPSALIDDDRVQREDYVERDDLYQHWRETCRHRSAFYVGIAFPLLAQFADGPVDQEKTAGDPDQIPPGHTPAEQ